MIDRKFIDAERLLDLILSDSSGNVNAWWACVEFVKDYMPPYPRPETRPTRLSIKAGSSFLRDLGHGYFVWDIHYGEDSEFRTPEHAILALMKAPVPPYFIKSEVWEEVRKQRGLIP